MRTDWLAVAQKNLHDSQLDGWLIHDFRGSNPVFTQLTGGRRGTTRRTALFVPADGAVTLLVHTIDAPLFANFDVPKFVYVSWQTFFAQLTKFVTVGRCRIAMEYSSGADLPAASLVDGGTIDAIRSMGATIVTSADLVQSCVAIWSDDALADHLKVSGLVAAAKDDAFDFIRQSLRAGKTITEYDVQRRIMSRFAEHGLDPDHPPIVGVNEHSGDPHFEPSATDPSIIKKGDWILIDLWARTPGEEHIFSDITWVGYCGRDVPEKHRRVYEAVAGARDACLQRAKVAWTSGETVQGWQLDDSAMQVIIDAGFKDFVRHRTGHSLSPGPKVHGLGVNIDNLETHDTRTIMPGIGFTIEPGIYLPEFGVRSEINVFIDPKNGPIVTSCIQNKIELLA